MSTVLLVAAVALIDGAGQILLQRRRLGAAHGGLWEFPGGKLEIGETPESAAVREIAEELALSLDPATLEPVTFASGPVAASVAEAGLVILLYMSRSWQGEPQCRDGEEIRWFAPEAIADLAMPPLDYPLARAVVSTLRQKSL